MKDQIIQRKDNRGVTYNDYPFEQVCKRVKELADQGHRCYQRFICEHCGQKLHMEEANKFFMEGNCDQCGKTTNIKARGCNYLLIMGKPQP